MGRKGSKASAPTKKNSWKRQEETDLEQVLPNALLSSKLDSFGENHLAADPIAATGPVNVKGQLFGGNVTRSRQGSCSPFILVITVVNESRAHRLGCSFFEASSSRVFFAKAS